MSWLAINKSHKEDQKTLEPISEKVKGETMFLL